MLAIRYSKRHNGVPEQNACRQPLVTNRLAVMQAIIVIALVSRIGS